MSKPSVAANTIASLVRSYHAIRRKRAECLRRGSTDDSEVTALSQETGRLRQQIRLYFQRKRQLRAVKIERRKPQAC